MESANQWSRTWPKLSFALGVLLVVAQVVQQFRGKPIDPSLLTAGVGLCGLPAFKSPPTS